MIISSELASLVYNKASRSLLSMWMANPGLTEMKLAKNLYASKNFFARKCL